MNPNDFHTTTTEGKAAVMLAHAGGAEIQRVPKDQVRLYCWNTDAQPEWNWMIYDYRVKQRVPREFHVYPSSHIGANGCFAVLASHAAPLSDGGILCREVIE